MADLILKETRISGETVFEGKILSVCRDIVTLPNGRTATRELVRHRGAVGVIALTDKDEVLIVRQYRYPISRVMAEIPAGKLEATDTDILEAAKRELEEETGYRAEKYISLGSIFPAAAYTEEEVGLFLATGLKEGREHPDEDEFLEQDKIPLETLVNLVLTDKIQDSKTQIAVLKVWAMKKKGII